MNVWEFGHSVLTGEWKVRREMMREQRAFNEATRSKRELMTNAHLARMRLYAGAEPGIARPMPNILSTPEDFKQAYERIVLIRAARQMEEDYGFFQGLLRDFENYVVGEQLVYLPNTGNPEADKVIREYLEWQFDDADYQGQDDLTKIAQIAIRSMKRDGECGFIPVDNGDSLKIRSVSGDCIGNPMVGANIGPNNYNGIITDDSGRVIVYQLYRRVPKLNAYYFDRDVSADNFWHYKDRFRFQQYHGVTAFMTAIRDGFDIDQILEFTKLNMKFRASQLPTIHTETGRPRGAGVGYFGFGLPSGPGAPNPQGTATNAAGVPMPMQIQIDGVTTTYLKTDESVVEYPNDFPNAQLHVSLEELRRQCCKGVDIPYEFAFRADNGGVVQRFWVNKAENTFARDKQLLKRTLLNPYKNRAIQRGIDSGFLDLSRFGDLAENISRFRGTWQMGKQISVDYGKENETDIKLIEAGLMSPQDKAASMGMNLDEISDEIEAHTTRLFDMAARIGKKVGRPVEEVLPFLVKKYPNAPAGTVNPSGDTTEVGGEHASALASIEVTKARADAFGVGVRAGAITPTEADEAFMRENLGLPKVSPPISAAWKEEPTRRPITLALPGGAKPAPNAPPVPQEE